MSGRRERPRFRMSLKPFVTMRPVRAPLRSITVLTAMVVPWAK